MVASPVGMSCFVSAGIPLCSLCMLSRRAICSQKRRAELSPVRTRVILTMGVKGEGSADGAETEVGPATWRDELRMLLDPGLSLSAKSVLFQDMSKRAPEIGKEAFEDVCSSAGLEGVPAVVQQITDDIVPDLVTNGPQYVAEIGRRVPDVLSDAVDAVQSGDPIGASAPGSVEEVVAAVGLELRNVFNKTPEGLETPSFDVVANCDGYQLRRYSNLLVAETAMAPASGVSASEVEAASTMGRSFNTLAKYLFGRNTSGGAMAMTTPVVIDYHQSEEGRMSFILPSKYGSDLDAAPQPVSPVCDTVSVAEREGGVYAVSEFSGLATAGEIGRQLGKLRDALSMDGRAVENSAQYTVLVYNGPGTVAFMRRNEICIRLSAGDDGIALERDAEAATQPQSYASKSSVGENGFVNIEGTTD